MNAVISDWCLGWLRASQYDKVLSEYDIHNADELKAALSELQKLRRSEEMRKKLREAAKGVKI